METRIAEDKDAGEGICFDDFGRVVTEGREPGDCLECGGFVVEGGNIIG